MPTLKHRQQKIQEKRKHTPWREFVKEICSWRNLTMSRHGQLISVYPKTDRVGSIISQQQAVEQQDDLLKKGIDYNLSKSFFEQFQQLWKSVEIANVMHYSRTEGAQFADLVHNSKNVYLAYVVTVDSENVAYSYMVRSSSNVYNSVNIKNVCDTIYFSSHVAESSHIFYSRFIQNSTHIWGSTNLTGCHYCIGCNDLTNQKYCIENKQLTKNEYEKYANTIFDDKQYFQSRDSVFSVKGANINSDTCTGEYIIGSEDIHNAFAVNNSSSGSNLIMSGSPEGNEHMYDFFTGGAGPSHHYNACTNCGLCNHIYCVYSSGESSNLFYSIDMFSCSYCLGCVGLRNKSFCIFNKQYTKEGRHEKVDEIFAQMEQEGMLGDFFPGWMNPFYFNDTAAYLIDDSFTKEEIEAKGYLRRDEVVEVDIPEGVEVVKVEDLGKYEGWRVGTQFIESASPEAERRIDPEILNKVIQDKSGNIYRIVRMEYDFLMKHGLLLPRLHRLDRLKMNFKIN